MNEKKITWVLDTNGNDLVAFNKNKDELGYLTLEMIGRHKHWVWYQMQDIYMSAGCLDELRDMQKKLSNFRGKGADLTQIDEIRSDT